MGSEVSYLCTTMTKIFKPKTVPQHDETMSQDFSMSNFRGIFESSTTISRK